MQNDHVKSVPSDVLGICEEIQRDEITEHALYQALAARAKNENNRRIFQKIAGQEKAHYEFFRKITGKTFHPRRLRNRWILFLSKILGLTFVLKWLEKREQQAQENYARVIRYFPEAAPLLHEEEEHEQNLLSMIEENVLEYVGSIVLGLNDALVELLGALAGMTLAIRDPEIIATAGFLTGVAASLSMAAAEYLSTREEISSNPSIRKSPIYAAIFTGIAYIITVLLLILPFLLLDKVVLSLAISLLLSVGIVALFNAYLSIAKDRPFWRYFSEMTLIIFGVSAFTFLLGWVVHTYWGVDV